MIRPTVAMLAVTIALGACGAEPAAEEADTGVGAKGQVEGGTISDAMIPLDELKSRPPAFRPAPSPAATGEAGELGPAEAGDEGTAPADDDAGAPAPDDSEPELPEG